MNKEIIIDALSNPDRLGYNDRGTVLFDNKIIWHESCSSCPNPFRPSTKQPWPDVYGWLAPLTTTWECIDHDRHGKCLLLNEGKELPARRSNVNHDGKLLVTEVFVHSGDSGEWRGSAGCVTVSPYLWPDFIKYFELRDKGMIAIIDKTAGSVA